MAMSQLLWWGLMTAAFFVMFVTTVLLLRSGTVVGPARVAVNEPAGLLLGLTVVALGVWIMIPGLYAESLDSKRAAAATAPATQEHPVWLTPAQSVGVSLVAALIVSVLLVAGNLLLRQGGLTRLGLGWPALLRGLLIGIGAALAVLPLTFLSAMLSERIWDLIRLQHPNAHEMLRILRETNEQRMRILILTSAILVAPFFEELLFRGHVQTVLAQLFRARARRGREAPLDRWLAIFITSGLFALVHGALWMMPPIFVLSLCLGYVYERTGNLWSAIVLHLLFNATNVTIVVSQPFR